MKHLTYQEFPVLYFAAVFVIVTLVAASYPAGEPDGPDPPSLADARGQRVELVSEVYGIRVLGRLKRQPGGLWAVVTRRSRVLFYADDVAELSESDVDGIELRIELARVGARP